MIKLIKRNEIFKEYKIISSEITQMQNAFFDEEMLQFYKEDDEENIFWEIYDHYNQTEINYSTYPKIISLNHSDIQTFTKILSKKLKELFKLVNSVELVILSHLKLDLIGNIDTDFKPLRQAYLKLKHCIGYDTYNEAFKIKLDDLETFIDNLFWIIRCDTSAPEFIFIFDTEQQIQIHICKYGNVHLTEFNTEYFTEDLLHKLGWTIIKDQEYDNFTEDGAIEGRSLKF